VKILLLLVFLLSPLLSAQGDKNAREQILPTVEAIQQRNKKSGQTFSIKKPKYTERWTYSTLGGALEYLATSYFRRHTKYSETYYLQSDQLVYATEREDLYSGNDENSEWQIAWTAHYYFKEGKLTYYWSSGHGKSEADDWDPDPVSTFRSRLQTLKKELKRVAVMKKKEAARDQRQQQRE
jgi:hypothetical protein